MPPPPLPYFGVGRRMLYFNLQLDMKNQHENFKLSIFDVRGSLRGVFQNQAGQAALRIYEAISLLSQATFRY